MIPLKSKDSNFMHYYNEEVMSFSDICTITKNVITYSTQPNFVAFFLIRKNDSTQKKQLLFLLLIRTTFSLANFL